MSKPQSVEEVFEQMFKELDAYLEKKKADVVFVVVRPDMDMDVTFDGAFSNIEAARACAKDPNKEYEGYVFFVTPDMVQDVYAPDRDEEEEV